MRDAVVRFDFCSYLVVAACLYAAAHRVAHHFPRIAGGMWWAGIVTLLLCGGVGYAEVRPAGAKDVFGIAVVSWICASAAALAAAALLPPLLAVYDGWKRTAAAWKAEDERRRVLQMRERFEQAEAQRREAEAMFLASLPPPPAPPPPPTKEALAAAAQERYETTLRMLETAPLDELERRAAIERAKQTLLRDLDKAMP